MAEILDATSISSLPLEIERLRRSKTWRRCKSEPFLAFYCFNAWMAALHGLPAGSLEDDDESLADLCGCTPLEWPRIRPMIFHGWLKGEDGRLHHPLIAAKAREALSVSVVTKNAPRAPRPAVWVAAATIDAFELWWAEYPRKIAKGAARTAYERALKKTGAEVLLDAAKVFARKTTLKEQEFLPYPATWLNQERFIEYRSVTPVNRSSPPSVPSSGAQSLNGRGDALEKSLGSAVFAAWFGGAELSLEPLRITFPTQLKRDWAASHFMPHIRRAIGECSLEVASERA